MDATQRNGGSAGLVAAALLLLLLVFFFTLGLDPQTAADPAKMLSLIAQKGATWALIGISGALAAAFAAVFSIGVFRRLRDRTPTRAAASLLLAAVGLASHGLAAVIQWQGGLQLAVYASTDQVGATHAWLAVSATAAGISGLANVFTGGSLLLAGWAIVDAGALSRIVGWVVIVAGALNLINVFAPTSPVAFLGAIIFTIIWLGWAGSQLRHPAPA